MRLAHTIKLALILLLALSYPIHAFSAKNLYNSDTYYSTLKKDISLLYSLNKLSSNKVNLQSFKIYVSPKVKNNFNLTLLEYLGDKSDFYYSNFYYFVDNPLYIKSSAKESSDDIFITETITSDNASLEDQRAIAEFYSLQSTKINNAVINKINENKINKSKIVDVLAKKSISQTDKVVKNKIETFQTVAIFKRPIEYVMKASSFLAANALPVTKAVHPRPTDKTITNVGSLKSKDKNNAKNALATKYENTKAKKFDFAKVIPYFLVLLAAFMLFITYKLVLQVGVAIKGTQHLINLLVVKRVVGFKIGVLKTVVLVKRGLSIAVNKSLSGFVYTAKLLITIPVKIVSGVFNKTLFCLFYVVFRVKHFILTVKRAAIGIVSLTLKCMANIISSIFKINKLAITGLAYCIKGIKRIAYLLTIGLIKTIVDAGIKIFKYSLSYTGKSLLFVGKSIVGGFSSATSFVKNVIQGVLHLIKAIVHIVVFPLRMVLKLIFAVTDKLLAVSTFIINSIKSTSNRLWESASKSAAQAAAKQEQKQRLEEKQQKKNVVAITKLPQNINKKVVANKEINLPSYKNPILTKIKEQTLKSIDENTSAYKVVVNSMPATTIVDTNSQSCTKDKIKENNQQIVNRVEDALIDRKKVVAQQKTVSKPIVHEQPVNNTEAKVKLNLAKGYLDIGYSRSANELLSELVLISSGEIKAEAQKLLSS